MRLYRGLIAVLLGLVALNIPAAADIVLKDNLQHAQSGDYIVITANHTDTLMLMRGKRAGVLSIEEVAIPECKHPQEMNWKEWMKSGAPNHTSWVQYDIDTTSGKMLSYYSFTKKNWLEIPEADNFFSKLLNLKLSKIQESARKRVGPKSASGPEQRPLWQPRMIVDGKSVPGIFFDAYKTRWPKDGSDLSGRIIELFLPKESDKYPAYFPYQLQVTGAVGKAKVRVIDSGKAMVSPAPLTSQNQSYQQLHRDVQPVDFQSNAPSNNSP